MNKRPLKQTKRIYWQLAGSVLCTLLIIAKAHSLDISKIEGELSDNDSGFSDASLLPNLNTNASHSSSVNGKLPLAYSLETYSLFTYALQTNQNTSDVFESYLDDYLPSIDWLDELDTQWQAELGLFVVNNSSPIQSSESLISPSAQLLSSEFNLGFRWGKSSLDDNSHFDSYSVLLGYGLADKVELNLGFSSLDVDERVYDSAFYEGTWYAGFSAKF